MRLSQDQIDSLEYFYAHMYSEFKRINRMRSEPFFAPRKAVLAHMKMEMLSFQSVFESLGIKRVFDLLPEIK